MVYSILYIFVWFCVCVWRVLCVCVCVCVCIVLCCVGVAENPGCSGGEEGKEPHLNRLNLSMFLFFKVNRE